MVQSFCRDPAREARFSTTAAIVRSSFLAQRSAKQHADLRWRGRSAGGACSDRKNASGRFRRVVATGSSQEYTCWRRHRLLPQRNDLRSNGTPIPGNDLRNCPSCGPFSPFAVNYVNAFPLPESSGRRSKLDQSQEGANVDSYDIRIDHRLLRQLALWSLQQIRHSAARDNLPVGYFAERQRSSGWSIGRVMSLAIQKASRWATRISSLRPSSMMRALDTPECRSEFSTRASTALADLVQQFRQILALRTSISVQTPAVSSWWELSTDFTGEDRATEFTGDGGPFYFLSNNFHVADAVTVVKEIQPTSLAVTIASGRTAITTVVATAAPKEITSTAQPIVGSSPVITTALVPTILVRPWPTSCWLPAWFCGPR